MESTDVVLQSIQESQQRMEGNISMLVDAFKRWADSQISKGSGNENSEHKQPTAEVANGSSPEASPAAPVAATAAPTPADTTGAASETAFGSLAPNAPPDVPGTIGKRMPERSTTS